MKPHLYVVNCATDQARHRIDLVVSRALRAAMDPEMPARHAAGECSACFYLPSTRLVGQAFTEWTCKHCEKPQPAWPNTGHPHLCLECAHRYGLCRTCLADDGLRSRRRITVVRRKARKAKPTLPISGGSNG